MRGGNLLRLVGAGGAVSGNNAEDNTAQNTLAKISTACPGLF